MTWNYRRTLLALMALVGLAGIGFAVFYAPRPLPPSALQIAPRGAVAVAQLDLRTVLRSTFWREAVGEQGDAGTRQIAERCGFDPLLRIDGLVLFATGDGELALDKVGLVLRGELRSNEMTECARKVIADAGGTLRRVEVEGIPALAARGDSRLAFIGADGAVAGDEAIVAKVVRVVLHGAPSASEDEALAALWRSLRGERAPEVLLAARIPDRWRARLRASAETSPLLAPLGSARAIGLAANVGEALEATLHVATADEADARALVTQLDALREGLLGERLLSLTVVGSVLRRLHVEARGENAVLTLSVRGDQVKDLVALWRQLGPSALGLGAPAPEQAPRETPPDDEETLRPAPGAP